jgi:hypothetical protein
LGGEAPSPMAKATVLAPRAERPLAMRAFCSLSRKPRAVAKISDVKT